MNDTYGSSQRSSYPFAGIHVSRELARNIASDVIRNGSHGVGRATSYNVRKLRNATDAYKRRCMAIISEVLGRDECPASMATPAYLAASLGRLSLLSAIAMDYDGDGEKDEEGNCSGNALAVYTLAEELADGAVDAFFGMPELLYGTAKTANPDATHHVIDANGGLYDGDVTDLPDARRRNLTRAELGFPHVSDIVTNADEKALEAVEGELAAAWQCILEISIVMHTCQEVADGNMAWPVKESQGSGSPSSGYREAALTMLRGCLHAASTFDIMGTGRGAFDGIEDAIGLVDRLTGIIDRTAGSVRRIGRTAGIICEKSGRRIHNAAGKETDMAHDTHQGPQGKGRSTAGGNGSQGQSYLMSVPTRPRPYIEGIGRPIIRFDADGRTLVWDEFRHTDMPAKSIREARLLCPWLSPTYIVGCVSAYLYDALACGKGDADAMYGISTTNIQHCSTVEVLVYGSPVSPASPYPPQKAKVTLRVDDETSAVSLHVSRQGLGIDVMPEVVIDWLEDGKTIRAARYVEALAKTLHGEDEETARENEFATMNGNLWASCPSDEIVRKIAGEAR